MPMRENCKQFESRTYPNGDTVRKCNQNLAPEAPWRCPDDCEGFEPRLADVNWKYGTLVTPPVPPEPEVVGDEGALAAVLEEAASIVNAVGASTLEEVKAEQAAEQREQAKFTNKVKRFFRRKS